MADSDHLHTICETASPPIRYLNEMSEQVKEIVKQMNQEKGVVCVGIDIFLFLYFIFYILYFIFIYYFLFIYLYLSTT